MAVYEYQPISLDRPAIRLLRLLSGKFTDDIRCELFEGWIGLSNGGIPYRALSYTWGSTRKTDKIIVNNSIMHITSNLYAALYHLRHEDNDQILWIDAICINQENNQEKNHQVQQMGYIYKEAEQVLIWLGEGTEESDRVMNSIKQLQERSIEVGGDWRRFAQLWICSQAGLVNLDLHKGMDLILGRPWFRRIWILQEIANARAATIICGTKSVLARIFAQVPALIGLQAPPHCQAVLDIMPGHSRKESWWGQKRDLHTLLLKFRESKATNERDIIFALLGISSDACRSDILLPDYEKSLQEVIRDTISFLMPFPNQDTSLYNFLDWTFSTFLQNLDSLSTAVFRCACENGPRVVVKLLLASNGIMAKWKDNEGSTPLYWATQNGQNAIVQLLLDQGAEIESKNKHGHTPLCWATQNGNTSIVQLLLDRGADVESEDKNCCTPLLWATVKGHKKVVKLLLRHGANPESKNKWGETPLSIATFFQHKVIVKLLLKHRANLEFIDKLVHTPLLWTPNERKEALTKLLLEYSANLEPKDKWVNPTQSGTPRGRNETVVKPQFDYGANFESEYYGSLTPLSWAAKEGNEAMVQLLLENGTNLEVKDIRGMTPLRWAAEKGHETIVKLLLDHGAKLESKDKWGYTPLSGASREGHEKVIKLLLDHGANIMLEAYRGLTPIEWAYRKGHKTAVKLLLEHSPNLESKDKWDNATLSGAAG